MRRLRNGFGLNERDAARVLRLPILFVPDLEDGHRALALQRDEAWRALVDWAYRAERRYNRWLAAQPQPKPKPRKSRTLNSRDIASIQKHAYVKPESYEDRYALARRALGLDE